jgi:UDPglucose 6-dehydrogenase
MPRIKELMRQPIFIDGRNLYEPDTMNKCGFIYRGVGRGYQNH